MDVFSRRAPSRVASLRPACLSGGLMFTIMGRGSPISANTPAAQPPSVPPLLHVWKEMRWKATLTSCTARTGVPHQIWSDAVSASAGGFLKSGNGSGSFCSWLQQHFRPSGVTQTCTYKRRGKSRRLSKRDGVAFCLCDVHVSKPCRHTQLPPLTWAAAPLVNAHLCFYFDSTLHYER